MSETAFRAVCERRRDGVWVDPGLGYTPFFSNSKRCGECKGEKKNWPEELALINIKPEEIEMGSKGECTICGANAEVRNTRGHMVCATCQKIVGYVDNHPERIAAAAKTLGNEAELAGLLGVGASDADSARQFAEWINKAIDNLSAVLQYDKDLNDTRSYADIVDLSWKATSRIASNNADFYDLREYLKPNESAGETLIGAAKRVANGAAAWEALMDRHKDAGFGEFADADPAVLAQQFMPAATEPARELEIVKADLNEARKQIDNVWRLVMPILTGANIESSDLTDACRFVVQEFHNAKSAMADASASSAVEIKSDGRTFDKMKGQMDDAVKDCLFEWALGQIADGKVELKMQILDSAT